MSKKGLSDLKIIAITLAVMAVLIVVVWMLLPDRQQPAVETETIVVEAPAPAEPEPQPEPTEAPEPELIEEAVVDDVEIELEDVIAQEVANVQPLTWAKPSLDKLGLPKYYTPEDAAKGKALVDGVLANFERISTLSVKHTAEYTMLVDNEWSRYGLAAAKLRNFVYDIEATRSPMYFRMSGKNGYGPVDGLVTLAGRKTNMQFQPESFIPMYMDDLWYGVWHLTVTGNEVRTDVTMDYDLEGLESYVKEARSQGKRYDVIVRHRKDIEMKGEVFFNRETGMPEFSVTSRMNPRPEERAIFEAGAWEYQKVGQVHYPKTVRYMISDFRARSNHSYTDLVINGVPASK